MAALKPSDVVVVTKLDRLGRSTRELLDQIEKGTVRRLTRAITSILSTHAALRVCE
jgi:DNA invertase Pin-like site-specific DNA recombinase